MDHGLYEHDADDHNVLLSRSNDENNGGGLEKENDGLDYINGIDDTESWNEGGTEVLRTQPMLTRFPSSASSTTLAWEKYMKLSSVMTGER